MKKQLLLTASLILAMTLAGCGGMNTGNTASSLSPKSSQNLEIPAEKEATLIYYLPTEDGLHIVPQSVKVKAADKTATEALKQMIRADRHAKYPILPAGVDVKSISIENNVATVNFTKEINTMKSETAQTLFVAMTVDTLTEFPNIKEVVFKAEGKTVQFQLDMTKSYKRDEAYIKK